MEDFNKIKKVRGVYYDINKGLYLIQTEKSTIIGDKWTTPGGQLFNYENPIRGLQRILPEEIGVTPNFIDPDSFFSVVYDKKRIRIVSYAYLVSLPVETTKYKIEGLNPNGTKFKFFPHRDLLSGFVGITRTTYEIIHSLEFSDKIRELEEKV